MSVNSFSPLSSNNQGFWLKHTLPKGSHTPLGLCNIDCWSLAFKAPPFDITLSACQNIANSARDSMIPEVTVPQNYDTQYKHNVHFIRNTGIPAHWCKCSFVWQQSSAYIHADTGQDFQFVVTSNISMVWKLWYQWLWHVCCRKMGWDCRICWSSGIFTHGSLWRLHWMVNSWLSLTGVEVKRYTHCQGFFFFFNFPFVFFFYFNVIEVYIIQ